MIKLTFDMLRRANEARQEEWPGSINADLEFRAIEVAGEVGELLEAVKKYVRARRGIGGSTATAADIADEMADAVIALDLLGRELEIDLAPALIRKFNRTSEKHDLRTRIVERAPDGLEEAETLCQLRDCDPGLFLKDGRLFVLSHRDPETGKTAVYDALSGIGINIDLEMLDDSSDLVVQPIYRVKRKDGAGSDEFLEQVHANVTEWIGLEDPE